MTKEWTALGSRIELRLIRVIDIFSILLSDTVVIVIGYGVSFVVQRLSNPGSMFFSFAKRLSEGLFLLLYTAMVCKDLWEFLVRESRGN
jgi:hypothetical protein